MKTRFAIFLLLFLAASQAHALSAEVKVDLLTHKITAALNAKNYAQAAELFKEYDALDVAMPPALLLQRAKVYFHEKDYVQTQNALEKYLGEAERGSVEYNQALAMYTDVEVGLELQQFWQEQKALRQATIVADMLNDTDNWTEMRKKLYFPCSEENYENCYVELDNPRGCYIAIEYYYSGQEHEWQGKCDRGFAYGDGTLRVEGEGWIGYERWEDTGSVDARGIPQGHWKKVNKDKDWQDWGPRRKRFYVNGELHGLSKTVYKGGVFDGDWSEFRYVNGKLHGTVTEYDAEDGETSYSCYRNGNEVDYNDPC